ncbi:hypothetical protein SMC26_39485 [Actinomadura fulvescens]|uniref:Uncharacterized protein n=1 Tax=Actinomadura fulvescens TaxID=46160 RepID=A0ABP6CCM7_9ACTN
MSLSVILSPNDTESRIRPEFAGTPAYFGKVEWFDVFDRRTDELLDWTISRVDGKECVVNHPRYGVVADLSSLNTAAEVCNAQYLSERRAAV